MTSFETHVGRSVPLIANLGYATLSNQSKEIRAVLSTTVRGGESSVIKIIHSCSPALWFRICTGMGELY